MAHRGASHLSARVALYYAPELDDPLWSAGCAWLGRDPERAVAVQQPDIPGISTLTADARGYGLHCTLKPPMRLSTSYADFRDDVGALAQSLRPFDLPALAVAELSGFLALRETAPSPALQALADLCVAWPDRHRQPPEPDELRRRRGGGLSPDADALLLRWGYPGVFGRWRFHITLTGRLSDPEREFWRPQAERHFQHSLSRPRRVGSLCLFAQAGPGAPFLLAERIAFG